MRFFASLLMVTILTTVTLFAQNIAPQTESVAQNATAPKATPTLTKAQRDSLALKATQRRLLETQAALLDKQYQESLQGIKAQYQSITEELNKELDATFKTLGLDRAQYDIDLESGKITPIKAEQPKAAAKSN